MDGYGVYKLWMGISLHFKTNKYDYFKYGCKSARFTHENYMSRRERVFYDVISEKVPSIDIEFMFASILFENPEIFITDVLSTKSQNFYRKAKSTKESLNYFFKQDMIKLRDELKQAELTFKESILSLDTPPLFRLYRYKIITPESMIVLNKMFGLFRRWDEKQKSNLLYQREKSKLLKYERFLGNIEIKEKIKIIKETYVNCIEP